MVIPTGLPLVTVEVEVGGRIWEITCVQNQDALMDAAETMQHFPYGFLLWESAVALSRRLASCPEDVEGKSVLELGTGVGLPSLIARSLNASVWQTDHQVGALEMARQNARRNSVEGIEQFLADWQAWKHQRRYDLVIGADILYERQMHYYLERVFEQCLAPGGRLLLADPGRPQALEFVAHLEKSGWWIEMETQTVLLDTNDPQSRPVDVALWEVQTERDAMRLRSL